MRRSTTLVAATLIGGALLAACSSGSTISTAATSSPVRSGSGPATTTPTEAPVSSEPPVPVESNPPGDIPDNTVFVPYHSANGAWTVTVPEGCSRTSAGTTVTLTDKLNTVHVGA